MRDGTKILGELPDGNAGHFQGEPALWSLLCADLMLFGFMFIVYAHDRHENLALFNAVLPAMNEGVDLSPTLLLLESSFFVAAGTQAAKRRLMRAILGYVFPVIVCGIAFCVLKVLDYASKFAAGITSNTDLSFIHFFALTGIPLIHVTVAIIVMGFAAWRYHKPEPAPKDFIFLESAACGSRR